MRLRVGENSNRSGRLTSAGGVRPTSDNVTVGANVVTGKLQVQDKLPKGTSKGDVIVGGSLLINAVAQFTKPNGAVVGRDHFRAVYSTASVATVSVTATLPGGTISCQGKSYTNRARVVLRVVGATGAFASATGTCEATKAPQNRYGADSLNVHRLQIPG